MRVMIINPSPLRFNVTTPEKEPLGGTESSVCWLARKMAAGGHDVLLVCNPLPYTGLPDDVDVIEGVRHTGLERLNHGIASDVVITVNNPAIARYVKEKNPAVRSMLWMHMMPDQPAMRALGQCKDKIDDFIFVSNAQRVETEKYFGTFKRTHIIGGAIAPCFENLFSSAEELLASKGMRAAYTSTPFRGLTYLLDAAERLPDLTFDIYSSMAVYQQSNDDYSDMEARMAVAGNVKSHGAIRQHELRGELELNAFYAYPCIFKETFCLSVLEAMAAGCKVVTTDLGALPDTGMGFADFVGVDYTDSKNFVRGFVDQMKWNITQFKSRPKEWSEEMFRQVQAVNAECSWAVRIREWEKCLGSEKNVCLDN